MVRSSIRCRALFAATLFAALAASTFAQQAELDALASRVAEKIAKRKKHVTLVLDFKVFKEGAHPLGSAVAAEFISSLQRVAPGLQVMDQSSIQSRVQEMNILAEDKSNWHVLSSIAAGMGAEVGVWGILTAEPSGCKLKIELLDLHAYSQSGENAVWEEFAKFESPIPLPPAWEELRRKPAEKPPSRFLSFSREKGDSHPDCLKCPDPQFSDEAKRNRIQGNVVVLVSVNAAGDTQDLLVLMHPGYGLAQAALDAVRRWKFKPARHKDGTPFATRIMIDVVFRFRE